MEKKSKLKLVCLCEFVKLVLLKAESTNGLAIQERNYVILRFPKIKCIYSGKKVYISCPMCFPKQSLLQSKYNEKRNKMQVVFLESEAKKKMNGEFFTTPTPAPPTRS
jgi:hypothetical protein